MNDTLGVKEATTEQKPKQLDNPDDFAIRKANGRRIDYEMVFALRAQGYSYDQIAKRMSCSASGLRVYACRHGWPQKLKPIHDAQKTAGTLASPEVRRIEAHIDDAAEAHIERIKRLTSKGMDALERESANLTLSGGVDGKTDMVGRYSKSLKALDDIARRTMGLDKRPVTPRERAWGAFFAVTRRMQGNAGNLTPADALAQEVRGAIVDGEAQERGVRISRPRVRAGA